MRLQYSSDRRAMKAPEGEPAKMHRLVIALDHLLDMLVLL